MATITGTSGNNRLVGTNGNDIIRGLGGNDTLVGSGGTDFYDGGSGSDTLDFRAALSGVEVDFSDRTISGGFNGTFVSIERVLGGAGEDSFVGAAGRQYLSGQGGTDILAGAAGNDTLSGGSGPDAFVFGETGTANADRITDFASGSDKIVLDADVMSALGPGGNFSGGDARFAANSAGMARDASDRIIYETDTRQIWYDSDGSGSAARQLIATLQSGATLAATDIVVLGGTSAPAPIAGTAGNDTLIGSEGNDTIDGLGGNDLLFGYTGADLLRGGDGNDSFVFREMGEANADQVSDFVSGSDKLHLDDAVFSAIGATGNFAADDGRFLANSTGTAQDADDRLIFNTSTGGLYYDADGSATGSGPQLIATLSAEPTATDIVVI